MNNNILRVDAIAFLTTLQLVVIESLRSDKIIAFGSGFLLNHNGHLFLVTADHVIHPDDHDANNENAQRKHTDYSINIITNRIAKNNLCSECLNVGGFYYFTEHKFDKIDEIKESPKIIDKIINDDINVDDESLPIGVRIPGLLDVAISELKTPLKCPLLSNQVVLHNGEILIEHGTSKLIINTQCIKSFNCNSKYLVAGVIKNDIKNSIKLIRENVIHGDLIFESFDNNGYAILKTNEEADIKRWEGLSGAPILDENGYLAGMLIRGPLTEQYLTAVPIDKIINFLDVIISNEEINNNLTSLNLFP